MTAITVDLDRLPSPERRRQETVLASLPRSFRLGSGAGSVVVVDGSQQNWSTRLIDLASGRVGAIFVTPPVPVGVAWPARLGSNEVPVVVDSRWADHPGWCAVAEELRSKASELSLVDMRTVWNGEGADALGAVLLEQVRCLDRILPLDAELEPVMVRMRTESHEVIATTEGITVNLVSTLGPSTGLGINLVGPARRWTIDASGSSPTSRLLVSRMDADGGWAPTEVYGSSTRALWMNLRRLLDGDVAAHSPTEALFRGLSRYDDLARMTPHHVGEPGP